MSFVTLFTAGLAAMAPLAAAYTQPKGDPSGNAITEPGMGSIVPVGKPFDITWEPSTKGKVSLVLLHGPSTNVVPIATIVESIDNSGKYSWTPSSDLAPNTTYYGLELIVDGTGQYQYSTQFGISNPDFKGSSSSGAASSSGTVAGAVAGAVSGSASGTAGINIKAPASSVVSDVVASASAALENGSSIGSSLLSQASSALSVAGVSASGVASGALATASAALSSAASAVSSHHAAGSASASAATGSMSTAHKTGTASASGTRSASASVASSTGAAGKVGAGFGSLALAAGVAAIVL